MPSIVSMSGGNISEARKGKQGTAPSLPARSSGNTAPPEPVPDPAPQSWQGQPGQCPLPVPARSEGKPCSKVRHQRPQLNALEPRDRRKPTQHNLQLSCAVSHFMALCTSHSFTGRSLHATEPPSPGISAMTCAIKERASRQAPKPGNLSMNIALDGRRQQCW